MGENSLGHRIEARTRGHRDFTGQLQDSHGFTIPGKTEGSAPKSARTVTHFYISQFLDGEGLT